ncbi:MAG TPA: hypothetical protein VEG38_18545, partial [Acidimicrobiia bacterium]|nr:hypothetical protein [Acidimicrobiia bacterium]
MSQVLVDAGVGSAGVVLPVLEAAYDAAWLRWNDSWQANRQFTGVDAAHTIADAVDREFPGSTGLRAALLDAFACQGEEAELRLVEGATDSVAALSERGIRLGIIC